jgi:predicted transposase YbfD/YdcC
VLAAHLVETESKLAEVMLTENKTHWVLDVTFGEDHARISRKQGAARRPGGW